MKRLIIWILSVALGVALLLAAVMGLSYSFTTSGSLPASAAQFGGAELEQNGYCWHVPLLGGMLDRVFSSSSTLTVQKLGVLSAAHPAIALPEWCSEAELTITGSDGAVLFDGSAEPGGGYDSFLYPANGEYRAELTVWRLPEGMAAADFAAGSNGSIQKSAGLETPARTYGCYHYSFRFTVQASADIELSADRMDQGGVIGMRIDGMVGSDTPIVETDLGMIQCVRAGTGWRCYLPAAYNAEAGVHSAAVTVNGETLNVNITVTMRDFGEAAADPEAESSERAATEFRNAIWPLYEQTAREKLWQGAFLCPLENYTTLVDYGQVRVVDGVRGSRSNSTLLYAVPGDPVRAPAAGVVVLARNLELTGWTVVIDHGCGLRSYLYGLASLSVSEGATVERGQALGPVGETLTMDFKLGSKSVNPWPLFQTSGGLFWRENG